MIPLKSIHHENFRKCLVCQMNASENGVMKEKLKALLQKADTEGISMRNWRTLKGSLLSMLESHQVNKRSIFKDKSITFMKSFPITKSSQISDRALISKGKGLSKYWNASSMAISKKLWLPTKTESVDLDMTLLSNSSKSSDLFLKSLKIMQSKTLSTSSQKTSCRSLQFSQPDTMVPENITYCRKIRIYPTKEQIMLFNKCIGTNRYFYNQANKFIKTKYQEALDKAKEARQKLIEANKGCVYIYKQGDNKGKQCCCKKIIDEGFCKEHRSKTKLDIDFSFLSRTVIRDNIILPESQLPLDKLWQKEIPYDTRQLAIDQVIAAYKSNFALIKNRENKNFNVSFKTKKSKSETFQINKKAINISLLRVFSQRLKKPFRLRNRDVKKLQEGVDGTLTCLKLKPGKWYLCIPRTKTIGTEPIYKNAAYKSVFLDPGVRSFQTFYSPDGLCGKIGDQYCNDFIKPITDKIDHLESIRSKATNVKTRRNLRNRLFNLRTKARNRIQDLHWKTCKFLCDGFDTIILPMFKSSEMVEKTPKRIISKKTVRQMLELSHCDFRNKLIYYAKTKQRTLILVTEEYTTKTCGNCGKEHNIGGSKVFSCSCGYSMDRDIHGARNICIKSIS